MSLNCFAIGYVSYLMGCHFKKRRVSAIAHFIAEYPRLHFVCLQEVWTQSDQQLIKNICQEQFPFSTSFHGGLVGSGTMILSRWPIEETNFLEFSMNGYIHHLHLGDGLAGSGIGLAQIRSPQGVRIHLYVSHLHAEYNRSKDAFLPDRLVQALEAGWWLQMTSAQCDLAIYCGDFNTEPGDLPHRVLTQVYGLVDPKHPDEPPVTFAHTENSFSAAYPDQRSISIDYVLYKASGRQFRVASAKLRQPLPHRIDGLDCSFSDHEALEAVIQLKSQSAASSTPPSEVAFPANEWEVLMESEGVLAKELASISRWKMLATLGLLLVTMAPLFFTPAFADIASALALVLTWFICLYFVISYQKRSYVLKGKIDFLRLRIQSCHLKSL